MLINDLFWKNEPKKRTPNRHVVSSLTVSKSCFSMQPPIASPEARPVRAEPKVTALNRFSEQAKTLAQSELCRKTVLLGRHLLRLESNSAKDSNVSLCRQPSASSAKPEYFMPLAAVNEQKTTFHLFLVNIALDSTKKYP